MTLTEERREIYIFTERFSVGETISVIVVKLIAIPGDAEYYLLETIEKNRLLLPVEPYRNFGINIGQALKCRVDKINCSGRIFIEPLHPTFVKGQKYDFEIISSSEVLDRKGRVHRQVQLKSVMGQVYYSRFDKSLMFSNGSIISCYFEGTRKGRLELWGCKA